LNKITSI